MHEDNFKPDWCPKCLDKFKGERDLRSIFIFGMCSWCFDHLELVPGRCKFCGERAGYGNTTCKDCSTKISIKIQNF